MTIPQELRLQLGLLPDTEVEFERDGNTVRIRKVATARQRRGEKLIEQMRGRGSGKLTTDQIMALTRKDAER